MPSPNWWIWIAVDIFAPFVYAGRGLHLIAGLHVVFLFMCIWALIGWRRSLKETKPAGAIETGLAV